MPLPEKATVGSLLSFLQKELEQGNVDADTPVFLEVYVLSREEEILKPKEDELGYHIPDESADEVLNFRMGVWKGFPEGKCREKDWENTVALSCYLAPERNNSFFRKVVKESVNADGVPY